MLPLDNYSGDPAQDYFAEGITDELTTDLAIISQLRVISRSSTMQFKGEHRPPTPEIAKMLDIDAILEGSVRRVGDKVRVTAQLIDARADKHLWAKTFERNSRDVLALQDELASAIAHEINVQLTPSERSRLTSARSVNPEGHDAYLKGRYFFNRPSDENLAKAIALFEQAVKLDPDFAPAYSGLSDAYLWAAFNEGVITAAEANPKAKAAAEKAIQLDDDSAEAHTSLAVYKIWYQFDWAGVGARISPGLRAQSELRVRARPVRPWCLRSAGRYEESEAEGKRATELDPLDPQIPIDNLMALAWQGKFQAATEEARRSAELDPAFFFAPWAFGWIDIQAGKVSDAIPEFAEGPGDGGAAVRYRMARVRVCRFGRSSARAGDDRGTEKKVVARLRAAIQPGDRLPWPRRSRTRAGLPGAGRRRGFAMADIHQRATRSSIRCARNRASPR